MCLCLRRSYVTRSVFVCLFSWRIFKLHLISRSFPIIWTDYIGASNDFWKNNSRVHFYFRWKTLVPDTIVVDICCIRETELYPITGTACIIEYRVAALFPEHFQSLTMAFQFVFLNNSFGTHCLSYLQKHNKQQTDTFQKICGNKNFKSSDSLQAPRGTDSSSFSQMPKTSHRFTKWPEK